MRQLLACAVLSSVLICSAQASVISLGPIDLSGQGLGATDPLLTLQAPARATTETGSVAPVDGTTFGALNWTSASDVRVLFNATEPQNAAGESITIDQITFSFESSAGTLNLSNSSPLQFPKTNPGVGNSGFLLGLDAGQTLALAMFLQGTNIADVRFGISALLSAVAGGPETFSAVSQIPLPAAGWLLLSALLGLALLGRKKKTRSTEWHTSKT